MKKLIFMAAFSVFLTGCGVGTYSVQSGVEDAAYLTFTDDAKEQIVVKVDDNTYTLNTVKQKAYKSGRNIKQTALNPIKTGTRQHEVKVVMNGTEVFSKKIFVSTGEHKIIEL